MTQIISAALGLEALRNSGYKDTSYAISELIDNSIEAKAKNIHILAITRKVFVEKRTSKQIRRQNLLLIF